jgi:glyoxylase-like metal-dependent hydrolase (beta-lactamase superfamily II)
LQQPATTDHSFFSLFTGPEGRIPIIAALAAGDEGAISSPQTPQGMEGKVEKNPGIHHTRVGDIIVTALNDGMLQASTDWATCPAADAEALLHAGFRKSPPMVSISSFLLTIGGRHALIDTGSGTALGPEFGHLPAHLATLGIDPADIATILVTHAHIDHIAGLTNGSGGAAFSNAELVLHEAEPAYWLDDAKAAVAPAEAREGFARAKAWLAPYGNRTRTVRDGGEALPGITAQHLPGHTPGHSGWRIASGGDQMLIWGDVVHLPAIQFARPEVGMVFDVDVEQGRKSRARAFEMAAADRLRVAGMHLDFPTFGHVTRAGSGYAFIPDAWSPGG